MEDSCWELTKYPLDLQAQIDGMHSKKVITHNIQRDENSLAEMFFRQTDNRDYIYC